MDILTRATRCLATTRRVKNSLRFLRSSGLNGFHGSVSARNGLRWTKAEDDQILQLRREGRTLDEIAESLSGRTPDAVAQHMYRARSAGTMKIELLRESALFTEDETRELMKLRDEGRSWDEITPHFPHRSWRSLQSRYSETVKRRRVPEPISRRYSSEEDRLLLRYRRELRLPWTEMLEQLPGRTYQSISQRFRRLLPRKARPDIPRILNVVTPADVQTVHRLRTSGMKWKDVVASIGKGSTQSMRNMYFSKRNSCHQTRAGRRWTQDEDSALRKLYASGLKWTERAADILGRNRRAILNRMLTDTKERTEPAPCQQ